MKVKTILVSQPEPKMENSPYSKLIDKEKVKVDFRPFIHVEGVDAKSVRQQKIDLNVVYRKRKIYVGKRLFTDLVPLIKKYKDEKFLLPSSDVLKLDVPETLESLNINWKRAVFYKTVISDLSDLRNVYYDILVFFSPSGIESLLQNFPDFEQKETRIAVFGNSTVDAANGAGLRIDIKAPTPETPSMTMALQKYITSVNK